MGLLIAIKDIVVSFIILPLIMLFMLFVMGVGVHQYLNDKNFTVETTAMVVDMHELVSYDIITKEPLGSEYVPYIRYTVDGVEYERVMSYLKDAQVGDVIAIQCNAKNPIQCHEPGYQGVDFSTFGVPGFVFLLCGFMLYTKIRFGRYLLFAFRSVSSVRR